MDDSFVSVENFRNDGMALRCDDAALIDSNCCMYTENLCLCYGEKRIINNISMRIETGAVTAIIGPSGSGKSSFLCCLNRLAEMICPTQVSGCVKLNERDIYMQCNVTEIRRRIGMVFQKPNPFPFSIWKNLEFPLKQHGITDKFEVQARIRKVLEEVGLWDEVSGRLHISALSLSGGQQQRLCLARALILEPEVILMDEPCSALDPVSTRKIEELILSLRGQCTVVIVTHNIAQAKRVADYVGLFWSDDGIGRLIEYGPTEQMFERPTNQLTASYIAYL